MQKIVEPIYKGCSSRKKWGFSRNERSFEENSQSYLTKMILHLYKSYAFCTRTVSYKQALVMGTCCIAVTGCTMAPGLYVQTDSLPVDNKNVEPLVKPILIPINANVVFHKTSESSCDANNGSWICKNNADYEYHIGSGDILTIIVYDHPELTNPEGQYLSPDQTGMPVNTDGTIDYPFIGRIEVAGLTVEQLADMLKVKLATYIQSPQINVRVSQFNHQNIQVLGEVMTEKSLPITNVPLNLLDAISAAGGLDLSTVNGKYIYVIRGPASQPKIYWLNASEPDALLLSEKFYLQSGDIVYVSTADVARWSRFANALVPTVQGVDVADETAKRK